MSVQSSGEGQYGESANKPIYRKGFLKEVHALIALGYARLDRDKVRDAQEPAVTGELVRTIRKLIDGRDSPRWASRYSVHDNPPVNVQELQGKKRPLVDIEMERTGTGPHPRFQLEAKRFPVAKRDAVGEYVGEDGLGCFLTGRYAATHD